MATFRAVKPWYRHTWPKVRQQILARDSYVCQIRAAGCLGTATTVDHIVQPEAGGAWFDGANLRAACTKCNYGRANKGRDDLWKRSATKIILVMGPPGSGTSEWADSHQRKGDLIVDYQRIANALGGDAAPHDAVMKARNSLLRGVRNGSSGADRVLIVSANPRAEEVFPFHERVLLDPGDEACIANLRAAGRAQDIEHLRAWRQKRGGDPTPSNHQGASRNWLGGG